MSLQNNVMNPVPLAQWQQVANEGRARITVDGEGELHTNNSLTHFLSKLSDTYEADNQAAFDNLFSAIHAHYNNEHLTNAIAPLLRRAREDGQALTSDMVRLALHVATDFAPLDAGTLCAKWADIGQTDVLSPRTGTGQALLREFNTTLSNRLAMLGQNFTREDQLELLAKMRIEVRDAQTGPEIKEKVESILRAYEQRLIFTGVVGHLDIPFLNQLAFPLANGYKLVMNGEHHDGGSHCYDNERGYMAGMMRGMNLMLATLNEPLSADLYERLHDTAVSGVHKENRMGDESLFVQGYRNNIGVEFGLTSTNSSPYGHAEFDQSLKANDPEGWITLEPRDNGYTYLIANAKTADECRQKAAEIIESYHEEMRGLQEGDEDGILRGIAKCCQDLDQHHLFSDGNIRTATFLTMNKLLLQNGLSPALLYDPNVFDMKSIGQIAQHIRNGQAAYRALV